MIRAYYSTGPPTPTEHWVELDDELVLRAELPADVLVLHGAELEARPVPLTPTGPTVPAGFTSPLRFLATVRAVLGVVVRTTGDPVVATDDELELLAIPDGAVS